MNLYIEKILIKWFCVTFKWKKRHLPKIIELMKIAGCEFLFLFAADNSEYEDLVNYYMDNLQFAKADGHSAAIPLYDFTCKFMYQITEDLEERRKAFFEAFNPDENPV